MSEFFLNVLAVVAALMLVTVTVAAIALALLYRRIKRLRIPDDASFAETLRAVPLGLVVALDLLDLGLDIFAAPVSWVVLSKLGLSNLRQVTAIEALIPGTQLVPTMTLLWIIVRLTDFDPSPRPRPRPRVVFPEDRQLPSR